MLTISLAYYHRIVASTAIQLSLSSREFVKGKIAERF